MILGLTGKEQPTEMKYSRFCQLCDKRIYKGELAIPCQAEGLNRTWYIHVNCGIEAFKMSRFEFKQNARLAKKRSAPAQTKVIHFFQDDGQINPLCYYCHLLFNDGDEYVTVKKRKKKHLHPRCYDCYRDEISRVKSSINKTSPQRARGSRKG